MNDVAGSHVPVLLLGFNRPEKMRRILQPLRQVKPRQMFVAVDGPRPDHPGEGAMCEETQRAAELGIDWPCDLHKLYRERNLGCRAAVSGAITWAFEHVDELIIIEDDCVVDPSFFNFCATLLDRYRGDDHVCCIAAANFQEGQRRGDGDYYASKYPHCWGWATWKRAWIYYEDDLTHLRAFIASREFDACHDSEVERVYWRHIFSMCEEGKVDSWAYRWTFSCWRRRAVTMLPNVNLVANIGYGAESTHTRSEVPGPGRPLQSLERFDPPSSLSADREADRFTFQRVFCPPGTLTESGVLHQCLKQLKQELKQCREKAHRVAEKQREEKVWIQKHPIRAAWRALRGRLVKFQN